jgi:putative transposase
MDRVGAACDNAATESFFSLLQKNVLDTPPLGDPRRTPPRDRHLDRNQVQPATTPALGKLTPVEFEMIYTTADAA